jgi:glutamyl-tRNA synthetase
MTCWCADTAFAIPTDPFARQKEARSFMPDPVSSADHPRAIAPDLAEVRVRFSPSPTGQLHIGGAKTAMYNVLFAHGQAPREGKGGAFVLRIEDTDRKRLVEGAAEGLMTSLRWLGLNWDEGPDVGGPYGPYVQSERTPLYRDHAEKLIASGHAYRCFCTPERLQRVREEQRAKGLPPGYDRHCRNLSQAEIDAMLAAGEPYTVRFKMPLEGETRFYDLLRGEIVYQNDKIEDLVLLKTDGYPTYHLANVVDDHFMKITHIFRAAEWIPTAPLHIQMYRAFGWDAPMFAHVPLILAPTGGKLSKRHGATSVEDFRASGYLPDALLNYLALLGWSKDDKTEIFSREDLLRDFTIERVSPSPSTFDRQKLDWLNQQYINHILTVDELAETVAPYLAYAGLLPVAGVPERQRETYTLIARRNDAERAQATPDGERTWYEVVPAGTELADDLPRLVHDACALLKDRIRLLTEAPDLLSYFLTEHVPGYDPALLVPKKADPEMALKALEAVVAVLPELDLNDEEAVEARLRALAGELELKAGQLFMPIRVAVCGRTQSPGLFETLRVIGQPRVSQRIDLAVDALKRSLATA